MGADIDESAIVDIPGIREVGSGEFWQDKKTVLLTHQKFCTIEVFNSFQKSGFFSLYFLIVDNIRHRKSISNEKSG